MVRFNKPAWGSLMLAGILLLSGCQTIFLPPGMDEAGYESSPSTGTPSWYPLDEGLDFYYFRDRSFPLALFALRVDIRAGLWDLVFTEPSEAFLASREGEAMEGITTTDFLLEEGCYAAVNGGPFSPYRWFLPRRGQTPSGLYVWEGQLLEGPLERFDALVVDEEGNLSIRSQGEYPFEGEFILGGFQRLLESGDTIVPEGGERTPRTALGISSDGRYLYLMVADGRREEYSRGLTLAETAGYLNFLGSHDALNMDGGGSSVMVLAEIPRNRGDGGAGLNGGSRARIVNRPVNRRGFPERIVATHLGIRKKRGL
ncbi:MAG: phosphodiester glycosidase family protein [Spirochaetales bacterium]|nr:phosphodiester glycosidase family protein [Spirochaetales bacterium]